MGYRLVGIVPAYDRDLVAPGKVLRVYEAIYAKVLVDDASVLTPEREHLTKQTRAVWDLLMGKG